MPHESERFHWRVALLLFVALFLGVSDTQLIPPILPLIAEDLGTPPGTAGWLVTVYALAAACFALISGPLSDRAGRKRLLVAALATFAVTAGLTFWSRDLTTLLILRAVTGMCAGTLSTCSLSYAGDFYPYRQRGRAMGVLSIAYFAAFVVGLPAGTMAAARLGWNYVFLGIAVTGICATLLIATLLPADRPEPSTHRILTGVRSHLMRRDRRDGIIAAFLTSGGIVGFLTYIGAWLRNSQGVSVEGIGLLLMLSGIGAAAASPLAGWLSDVMGKKAVIVSANLFLAALFPIVASLAWGNALFAAVIILSVAASARQAPLHALTTELVDAGERGQYVALRNASSQLGIAGVAATSAVLFDWSGFMAVAWLAAGVTVLIPAVCASIKEPQRP